MQKKKRKIVALYMDEGRDILPSVTLGGYSTFRFSCKILSVPRLATVPNRQNYGQCSRIHCLNQLSSAVNARSPSAAAKTFNQCLARFLCGSAA